MRTDVLREKATGLVAGTAAYSDEAGREKRRLKAERQTFPIKSPYIRITQNAATTYPMPRNRVTKPLKQ